MRCWCCEVLAGKRVMFKSVCICIQSVWRDSEDWSKRVSLSGASKNLNIHVFGDVWTKERWALSFVDGRAFSSLSDWPYRVRRGHLWEHAALPQRRLPDRRSVDVRVWPRSKQYTSLGKEPVKIVFYNPYLLFFNVDKPGYWEAENLELLLCLMPKLLYRKRMYLPEILFLY